MTWCYYRYSQHSHCIVDGYKYIFDHVSFSIHLQLYSEKTKQFHWYCRDNRPPGQQGCSLIRAHPYRSGLIKWCTQLSNYHNISIFVFSNCMSLCNSMVNSLIISRGNSLLYIILISRAFYISSEYNIIIINSIHTIYLYTSLYIFNTLCLVLLFLYII